jgi:hypothetical protein
MTTLLLKAPPQLSGFARFAAACDAFLQAWAEAKALALKAQRQYPFAIE